MSQMLHLGWRDLAKGLVVAILSPVVITIYQLVISPNFTLSMIDPNKLGILALGAGLSYIIKNLLTNSEGKFLGAI